MRFNLLYILIGLVLLYAMAGLLLLGFSYLFQRYYVKAKFDYKQIWRYAAFTVAWLLTALIVLAFFASSVLALGLVFFLVFLAVSMFLAPKLLLIDVKHKIVYSLSLAVLLNPAWLFLMGIGK